MKLTYSVHLVRMAVVKSVFLWRLLRSVEADMHAPSEEVTCFVQPEDFILLERLYREQLSR